MFYKFENNEWFTALEIHFPDGTILNSSNRTEKDGWKWHDVQPYEDEII
jgi:hypothetical protein